MYLTRLTTLGKAKIAAAIANNSQVGIATIRVGDANGNPYTPTGAETALVHQTYSGAVNSLFTAANNPAYVVAEMIIPSTVGGWNVVEVGCFDSAGDMIAIANFPSTYKPMLSEGTARDLVIRLILEVTDSDAVELLIDPSVVLASRQWVLDNFSLAILLPGGTTGMILRKASNADGDTEWYDATAGLNLTVDVVEEYQTLTAAQTVVTLAVANTAGLAVYVNGSRKEPGVFYTVTDNTHILLAAGAAGGERIMLVQNEPAGTVDFMRKANNLSDLTNKATARANLELTTDNAYLNALYVEIMKRVYPVGEILETRRAGNPVSWLTFGTWEAYAAGRVKVGYDGADATFNALDAAGGTKTHQLITAELPSHTHFVVKDAGQNTGVPPTNTNSVARQSSAGGDDSAYSMLGQSNAADVGKSSATGSGTAHNNLQPYIVVYMWKRTA